MCFVEDFGLLDDETVTERLEAITPHNLTDRHYEIPRRDGNGQARHPKGAVEHDPLRDERLQHAVYHGGPDERQLLFSCQSHCEHCARYPLGNERHDGVHQELLYVVGFHRILSDRVQVVLAHQLVQSAEWKQAQ